MAEAGGLEWAGGREGRGVEALGSVVLGKRRRREWAELELRLAGATAGTPGFLEGRESGAGVGADVGGGGGGTARTGGRAGSAAEGVLMGGSAVNLEEGRKINLAGESRLGPSTEPGSGSGSELERMYRDSPEVMPLPGTGLKVTSADPPKTFSRAEGEGGGVKRMVWTGDLHLRFIEAINQLGVWNAMPKRIVNVMNVEGLTRENVASHLQKYRNLLRKLNKIGVMKNNTAAVSAAMSGGSEAPTSLSAIQALAQAQALSQLESQLNAQNVLDARAQQHEDVQVHARAQMEAQLRAKTDARAAFDAHESARANMQAQVRAQAQMDAYVRAKAQVNSDLQAQAEAQLEAQIQARVQASLVAHYESRARAQQQMASMKSAMSSPATQMDYMAPPLQQQPWNGQPSDGSPSAAADSPGPDSDARGQAVVMPPPRGGFPGPWGYPGAGSMLAPFPPHSGGFPGGSSGMVPGEYATSVGQLAVPGLAGSLPSGRAGSSPWRRTGSRPSGLAGSLPWGLSSGKGGSPYGGVAGSPYGVGGVAGSPYGVGGLAGSPYGVGGLAGSPYGVGGLAGSPYGVGGLAGGPYGVGGLAGSPYGVGGLAGGPYGFGGFSGSPYAFGGNPYVADPLANMDKAAPLPDAGARSTISEGQKELHEQVLKALKEQEALLRESDAIQQVALQQNTIRQGIVGQSNLQQEYDAVQTVLRDFAQTYMAAAPSVSEGLNAQIGSEPNEMAVEAVAASADGSVTADTDAVSNAAEDADADADASADASAGANAKAKANAAAAPASVPTPAIGDPPGP